MTMYRKLLAMTSALLLAYGAGEALAFTTIKCGSKNYKWSPPNVYATMYATRAGSVSFPVGPWRDALQSVVNRWHDNPSNLDYSASFDDSNVGLGSGQSEVRWDSGFGAPARTN